MASSANFSAITVHGCVAAEAMAPAVAPATTTQEPAIVLGGNAPGCAATSSRDRNMENVFSGDGMNLPLPGSDTLRPTRIAPWLQDACNDAAGIGT